MTPRQRETKKLVAIEKRSVQFVMMLLLASLWFQSWPISLGLIWGGGIAILNFRWLWRIVEKTIFEHSPFYGVQTLIKFALLALVIFLVLRYMAVNPIAFIVGTSTLVAGILFEGIRESLHLGKKGKI